MLVLCGMRTNRKAVAIFQSFRTGDSGTRLASACNETVTGVNGDQIYLVQGVVLIIYPDKPNNNKSLFSNIIHKHSMHGTYFLWLQVIYQKISKGTKYCRNSSSCNST